MRTRAGILIILLSTGCTVAGIDYCDEGAQLVRVPGREHEGAKLIRDHCTPEEAATICAETWHDIVPPREQINADSAWFRLAVDVACSLGAFPAQDGSLVTGTSATGIPRSVHDLLEDARRIVTRGLEASMMITFHEMDP
ncbi:hypothetical protein HY632_04515 [Candidatus Uhrbacteria bacterium]|nr:hypothetical protein [Candidatus Uhrbacteria bacterium]